MSLSIKEIDRLHGLHLCGMSVYQVARTRTDLSARALLGYFQRRGLKTRGRKDLQDFVVYNGVKFTKHKITGQYRATTGNRETLFRAVWKASIGEIPRRHLIISRDGTYDNYEVETLVLISKEEHLKLFPKNNQHTIKGTK